MVLIHLYARGRPTSIRQFLPARDIDELVQRPTVDVVVHPCASWMSLVGWLNRDQVSVVVVREQDCNVVRHFELRCISPIEAQRVSYG